MLNFNSFFNLDLATIATQISGALFCSFFFYLIKLSIKWALCYFGIVIIMPSIVLNIKDYFLKHSVEVPALDLFFYVVMAFIPILGLLTNIFVKIKAKEQLLLLISKEKTNLAILNDLIVVFKQQRKDAADALRGTSEMLISDPYFWGIVAVVVVLVIVVGFYTYPYFLGYEDSNKLKTPFSSKMDYTLETGERYSFEFLFDRNHISSVIVHQEDGRKLSLNEWGAIIKKASRTNDKSKPFDWTEYPLEDVLAVLKYVFPEDTP